MKPPTADEAKKQQKKWQEVLQAAKNLLRLLLRRWFESTAFTGKHLSQHMFVCLCYTPGSVCSAGLARSVIDFTVSGFRTITAVWVSISQPVLKRVLVKMCA